jgi:hypothetical protein
LLKAIDDVRSDILEGVKFIIDSNEKKSNKDLCLSELLEKASDETFFSNEKIGSKGLLLFF